MTPRQELAAHIQNLYPSAVQDDDIGGDYFTHKGKSIHATVCPTTRIVTLSHHPEQPPDPQFHWQAEVMPLDNHECIDAFLHHWLA